MQANFLSVASAIAPLIVVIYLAWKEYRSGDSRLKKEIQADFELRNNQLEKRVKELETHDRNREVEIAKLQATLDE